MPDAVTSRKRQVSRRRPKAAPAASHVGCAESRVIMQAAQRAAARDRQFHCSPSYQSQALKPETQGFLKTLTPRRVVFRLILFIVGCG